MVTRLNSRSSEQPTSEFSRFQRIDPITYTAPWIILVDHFSIKASTWLSQETAFPSLIFFFSIPLLSFYTLNSIKAVDTQFVYEDGAVGASIFLLTPLNSTLLNNCDPLLRAKSKKHRVLDSETVSRNSRTLPTDIITSEDLYASVGHYVRRFDDCINKVLVLFFILFPRQSMFNKDMRSTRIGNR